MRNVINDRIRQKYNIDICCRLSEWAFCKVEEQFKQFLRDRRIVRSLLDEEAYELCYHLRRKLEPVLEALFVAAQKRDQQIAHLTEMLPATSLGPFRRRRWPSLSY